MVAHTFSCPQGLYFNEITDGCDFLRNGDCGSKDIQELETKKEDIPVNESTKAEDEDEDIEDPKSLKDILEIVKAAGKCLVRGLTQSICCNY